MTENRRALYSGGCQCGAVRYALYAEPYNKHICHCRMCQKAVGGFYAALAVVKHGDFVWTRGTPSIFASSPAVERGFCGHCGTPLSFNSADSAHINFTIASLDTPAVVKPEIQIGIESRMPWHDQLSGLDESQTEEILPAERYAKIVSRQHPDHDTEDWTPKA